MNGKCGDDESVYFASPNIMMETKEEVENGNYGDNNVHQNGEKRKRTQRYMPQKIEELEKFFKEFPHPNASQSSSLGNMLKLDVGQVMHLYEIQRNNSKSPYEHNEKMALNLDYCKVRRLLEHLRQAMKVPVCIYCGKPINSSSADFEAQQIMAANARFKEEESGERRDIGDGSDGA